MPLLKESRGALAQTLEHRPLATSLCEATFEYFGPNIWGQTPHKAYFTRVWRGLSPIVVMRCGWQQRRRGAVATHNQAKPQDNKEAARAAKMALSHPF